MITLYTWRDNIGDTKVNQPNYVATLRDYIWHKNFPRSILLSILHYQLNFGSLVDMKKVNGVHRSKQNKVEANHDINHIAVDSLEAIIITGGETKGFVINNLDTELESLDQGVGTYDWSYNRNIT